jgi:hypothetical protein
MGTDLCFFASSRAAPRRSQHLSSCLCNSRKGKSAAGRGARFTLCGSSSSSDSERTRKRCLRESVLPVFTRWHRRDLCPLGIVGHLDWVTRFPYRLVVRDRSPLDRRGGRAANSRYMRQPLERRFGCLEQCSYAVIAFLTNPLGCLGRRVFLASSWLALPEPIPLRHEETPKSFDSKSTGMIRAGRATGLSFTEATAGFESTIRAWNLTRVRILI